MRNHIIYKVSYFILLSALLAACKKDADLPEQERLFRPVLKGTLEAGGNYIDAAWERMEGAISYTVEISRDTFKTIDQSITIDSARTTFLNLKWDQTYRLQVKANAPDSAKNSRWGYLGEIKTPKFPTILFTPGASDINATQVRVTWKREGAEVTGIKILNASDSSVAKDVTLTAADVNAQFKVVDGLTPGSPYIIYLYSGTSLRGWENFSTAAQLSGTIIDLTQITNRPRVLLDTLPLIDAGSTVLLKKGQVYAINAGMALTKAVTITSGDDLTVTTPPTLYFTANFGFASGANVDYIRFDKLNMRSDNYASRYVFNVNTACNVGEISFSNCNMGAFRGVTRFQDQNILVGKYIVNNCMIDSIKDYGVLSVDGAKALVMEMKITNSTIYKTEKLITSTKPTGTMTGIVVENCSFNQVPLGGVGTATGNTLIDCLNQKFTGNILFKNNIVGPGLQRENVIVRGIRPGLGSIEAANNYKTSDASIAADGPIPDIISYSGSSTDLFTSPATGNFKIKDNAFAGKSTAGDPRWRP
jgi:hypothetical protein